MKPMIRILAALAVLASLVTFSPPSVVQAVSCAWDGSDGNWSEKAKWDCNQVPGQDDEAFISHGQVSVNDSTRVKSLSLSGGILTGAGSLTVDTLNWSSGGTIAGTGSITVNSEAKLTGSNYHVLDGRTFNNAGTATYSKVGPTGFLYLYTPETVFNNLPGAKFIIDQSGSQAVGGSGTFNNEGRLIKTSFDDPVKVAPRFINAASGTVEVEAGRLQLHHLTNTTNSGSYRALSGATLQNGGVQHAMTGAIQVTGGGTFEIICHVDLDGSLALPDGILSLPANGVLDLSTASTSVSAATFNLSLGHLTGPGSLTAGTINWSAGNMTGGGSTTATTALNITGSSILLLEDRILNNAGTGIWHRGTVNAYLTLQTEGTTAFNNLEGATFTVETAANTLFMGSGTFINAGTFIMRSPGSSATLGSAWINAGTGLFKVETGTLVLHVNKTAGFIESTGSYEVLSGAVLRLTGGSHNLAGDLHWTGEGVIETNATLNLDGSIAFPGTLNLLSPGIIDLSTPSSTVTLGTLNQTGGTVTGPGSLTAEKIYWSGGIMSGAGATTAGKELHFEGTGMLTLGGRVLNNEGAATWDRTGSGYLYFQAAGSVFNNKPGATFTVLASGPDVTYGSGAFNNDGTLNLTTGKVSVATFSQASGGKTNLAVSSATPLTGYSRIITTQSNLAGDLKVDFTGGYIPVPGDAFTLLTYTTTRSGDFSSVSVEPVSGIIWMRCYPSNSLRVWAAAGQIFIPLVVK